MNHKRYAELADKGKKPSIKFVNGIILMSMFRFDPDDGTRSVTEVQVNYDELIELRRKLRKEIKALDLMIDDIDNARNNAL